MSEWWTANDAYIPGFLGGKRKGTRFEGNFWEWWEWKDIFGVRVVDVQCDAAVFWWERLFYTLIWRNLNRRVFRLLVVLNQVINCLSYLLFPKISNPVFSYAILCSSALLAHCWDRGSFELVNIPPVPRIFQKEIWCHQLHQLRSFYAWEKNAKIWTKAKWDKKTQLKLRVTNLSLQSFWICLDSSKPSDHDDEEFQWCLHAQELEVLWEEGSYDQKHLKSEPLEQILNRSLTVGHILARSSQLVIS